MDVPNQTSYLTSAQFVVPKIKLKKKKKSFSLFPRCITKINLLVHLPTIK